MIMKNFLTILFVSLSIFGYGQTIGTSQIRDAAITQPKLAPNALRPVDGGVLSNFELTFDQPSKKYTLTVSSDIALTLASSGNIASSFIYIYATGNGTNDLSFPSDWVIKSGTYNPSILQRIFLEYVETPDPTVLVTIEAIRDVIEASLTDAVVDESTPAELFLTFDYPVTATTAGWTLESGGSAVGLVNVSSTGTETSIFTLVRDIEGGETLTISYDPATGSSATPGGNELETITDFPVDSPPETPPVEDFDIYVDDDAVDDIAAGTIGDPYKTIQAASNAAISGQVIGVRAGTYRETIVAKTGVTYEEYPGEVATVSGFNVMSGTGWTVHSGNIYRKTITLPVNGYNTSNTRIAENSLNLTIFANQILRNSVMQIEARYPNIDIEGTYGTDDYLRREEYREGIDYLNGFNTNNLTDASFPVAAPGLINATLVSNGWIYNEARTITGHSGNQISWAQGIWDNSTTGRWMRKRFYITNDLQLLDQAGEWHYESGTLYFWQVGGGSPSGTIEYKARNWGFDIRDRQNVTIKGLNFIGCEAAYGNANSTGAVLDGITAVLSNHHVRHDVNEWQGVGMSKQFGIRLIGANSTIKNSDIGYGASQGIWGGPGFLCENNYIHDLGYVGQWANGCSPWGNIETGGFKFLRNTTENTGRSGFDFGFNFHYGDQPGAPQVSRKFNFEIAYNDFSGWGSICQDVGGTYAWGQNDLIGLDYHHNWFHDSHAPDRSDVGLNVGIYFDQSTGPGRIHHNVVWAAGAADMYHETHNDPRPFGLGTTWIRPYPTMDIYNNTFANSPGFGVDNSPSFARSYITYEPSPFDRQRNNIYMSQRVVDFGSDIANSVNPGTNPQFLFGNGTSSDIADINANSGLYFQLSSTSPARGIGINNYAGVTGTITDAGTDAGAYMYNDPNPWVPGRTAVVTSNIINDNNSSITYSASNWSYFSPFKTSFTNSDAHVTSAQGATLQYVFTSTEISVTSEKCDNMGTIRVEIFDDAQNDDVYDDIIGTLTDVNLYLNTGGTAQDICPNGQRQTVFSVDGLVAGDKMIKITLQTIDNTVVPARNTFVFDDFNLVVP